jgi:hypothetical protein
MTKEELLPLAKTYFDSDKNRTVIFGTEDKHFFNSEGDAKYYCKDLKKFYPFYKSDFEQPKKVVKQVKVVEVKKEEPKKEVKSVKTEPKKVIKKG